MRRHDSRAPRFSEPWLELLLAAGCLVASAGDVVAMSVAAGPPLPGPVLIQEAPGAARGQTPLAQPAPGGAAASSFGELHEALAAARERLEELSKAAEAVAATGHLREQLETVQEENRQLLAEIEGLRSEDRDGESAKRAAEARVVELSRALEEAKGQAGQIDEELIAVRWQNAQLNTSLAQTRAAREEDQAKARQTQEASAAEIEALKTNQVQTAAVMARLREQVEESEHELAAASSAQNEASEQIADLRRMLQQAEQQAAGAGERLAAVEEQLSAASEQAVEARRERARTDQRAAALESERNELRTRLATLSDRLEQAEIANGRLETQVAELRDAASAATTLAQQNLLAVEQRIKQLNEALGAIATGPSAGLRSGANIGDDDAPEAIAVAAAPSPEDRPRAATAAAANRPEADLDAIKTAGLPGPPGKADGPAILSDLSLEQRLQVQGLVADLDGTMDDGGLKMVVPGGILFAVNSDEVQDGAHDLLAKVAELINMYEDRSVRIVGHTDALGDAAYNKTLSERRAGLVKQFFVDHFDVKGTHLSTEGMGEADPIASNATLAGRRANRRVEILILN